MNKICRICLEEGVVSSIFTRNFNITLCEMIEYCSNVKITKDDGLPDQLCSNCVYKLGIAYHFKQTCEAGNIRLRQYLGLAIQPKFNDASVMTDPIPATSHITVIKKCKCQPSSKKSSSNYRRKPETEKLKRGPKPKPKQVHNCYECNKEFRCQAQLEMHLRTHTGDRPFVCMYCQKSFAQKHNLTIHMRTHTGDKPFQCDVCSKTFAAQGNLLCHLKIHTGQRDHQCTICNKTFITSSELTRHLNKHKCTKNKKYKCQICGVTYVQNRDLKLHKLKVHQTELQLNNDANQHIDIIGLDSAKEGKETIKQTIDNIAKHDMEKQTIVDTMPKPTIDNLKHIDNLMLYDKRDYMPQDNHNCTVCGSQFSFLTELAQHYLHSHNNVLNLSH